MVELEVVACFWIDPLTDSRWTDFIRHHACSSVFHTPEWMRALYLTYGYTPIVLTTSPPGQSIANGIPFCRINSALTGKRLISLPFSDHCQPLANSDDLQVLLPFLMDTQKQDMLKFVELRPLKPVASHPFSCSQRYYFHSLDLRFSLEDIFQRFHLDCVRRKIHRAEREGLTTEFGRSDKLLEEFYSMQVITRRRHGYPPQPRQWFKNLLNAMGENATIRVARYRGRPISSILILDHKRTAIYKYSCSELSDNKRGGTQLILWQAIEDAKAKGMEEFDLGRSDIENPGLSIFKERWGAKKQDLEYFKYPAQFAQNPRRWKIFAEIIKNLPKPILTAAGRLLYRHIA
jgi:hypothetical protein